MPETSSTEDQVRALLDLMKHADEVTQELALDCLKLYGKDCGEWIHWQRTEGRDAVLQGADPAEIRRKTLQKIEEARQGLRDKLTKLLAWSSTRTVPPEGSG